MSSSIARSHVLLLFVAVLAAGTSACGGVTTGHVVGAACGLGTRSADVVPAIRCYMVAISRQDAQAACGLLTRQARAVATRRAIATGSSSCVTAAKRGFALINERPDDRRKFASISRRLQIHDLVVRGSSATATLSVGTSRTSEVRLRIEDGGWRLEAAGLTS